MRNAKTGGFVKASSAGAKRRTARPAPDTTVIPDAAIQAAALATVVDAVETSPPVVSMPIPVEPVVPKAIAAVSAPIAAEPAPPAAEPSSIDEALPVEPAMAVSPEPSAAATPSDPTPSATEEIPMNDTIQAATQTATDKTQAMFADVNARGKDAMEKSKVMIEEMNSFSKGNIEAIVESSKIAAKGIETMAQDTAAYAKTSFEGATQAMKTMAAVKSPTELMTLQSDYMRSAFDAMVAHTSRTTEMMMKLAGDVAQPLSSRMAIAAQKVKIAA